LGETQALSNLVRGFSDVCKKFFMALSEIHAVVKV
jgi:hypothetical protein